MRRLLLFACHVPRLPRLAFGLRLRLELLARLTSLWCFCHGSSFRAICQARGCARGAYSVVVLPVGRRIALCLERSHSVGCVRFTSRGCPPRAGGACSHRTICSADVDGALIVATRHAQAPGIAAHVAVLDEASLNVGLHEEVDRLATLRAGNHEFVWHVWTARTASVPSPFANRSEDQERSEDQDMEPRALSVP